jgi:hypothetical protein
MCSRYEEYKDYKGTGIPECGALEIKCNKKDCPAVRRNELHGLDESIEMIKKTDIDLKNSILHRKYYSFIESDINDVICLLTDLRDTLRQEVQI